MEHGASDRLEEQSHTEITIKTEVEEAVESTTYSDVEITVNYFKEEPGLPQLVKSEPALSVNEEVVEVSWQDMDWQQDVEATPAPTIAGSLKMAAGSMVQDDELNIKDERADTEMHIGPTALQHMHSHNSTKQPDAGVKQESTINEYNVNPIPCGGVKEETSEEECTGHQDHICCVASGFDHTYAMCHTEHQDHTYCIEIRFDHNYAKCHTFTDAQHREGTQSGQRIQGNEHCSREHATRSHECAECNQKYICEEYLATHIRNVHSKQQNECAVCKKMCKSKQALYCHVPRCLKRTVSQAQGSKLSMYVCDYCQKTYKARHAIQIHIAIKHTNRSYKCNQCNRSFKCKEYVKRHTATAHSVDMRECNVCGKSVKAYYIRKHMRYMHERVQCKLCAKVIKSRLRLHRHLKDCPGRQSAGADMVHSVEMRECNVCGKSMKGCYLRKHMRYMHEQVQCELCAEVMKSSQHLRRHLKDSHGRQFAGSELHMYVCDYCQKTYKSKGSLRFHITCVHTSRSYKCNQCNRIFKCKEYLKRHTVMVHSDMQECNVCGKSVKAYYIREHMLYMHEQVQCNLCAEVMKSRQYLRQHLKNCRGRQSAGSERRKNVCDYCHKTYKGKCALRIHIASEHTSKSFKCNQCNKSFKCKQYVTNHMATAHSVDRRKCNVCGKSVKAYNIREHMRYMHKQVQCKLCAEVMKSRQYLRQHLKDCRGRQSAGSRRQFTCSNCGKNYKTRWFWQKHEDTCKLIRPTASDTSAVASTSTQQHGVVMVKEEPADGELELGPVVFQHMDCNYRPYKQEPQLD